MADATSAPHHGTPAEAGHAIYSPAFLAVYDPLVLRLYSNLVWRCPVGRLVRHYRRHIGERHLDVGPGTGYFLQRADLADDDQLTLLDPSPHVLSYASRRLARLRPSAVRADVREELPLRDGFDSAAMSYVLHCLPGPPERKAAAVRNVAAVLEPRGVLFGATVLGEAASHSRVGRAALRDLNRKGVFYNHADTEGSLRGILAASFADVSIEIVGAVALFSATGPIRR